MYNATRPRPTYKITCVKICEGPFSWLWLQVSGTLAPNGFLNSAKFALEPRATYLQMFYPNNGPQMKEFIFAIPYDAAASALPGTNSNMYHGRYDLPRSEVKKFSIPFAARRPAWRPACRHGN